MAKKADKKAAKPAAGAAETPTAPAKRKRPGKAAPAEGAAPASEPAPAAPSE